MAQTTDRTVRGHAGPLSYGRWANVLLGAWLFASAFLWPRWGAAFTNTWIMGVVIRGFALIGMVNPAVRFVNTAAGAWVFIAAFVLRHVTTVTVWNDAIVGALAFLVALAPNEAPSGGISSP